jgi:predicted nucleic acid-binding protein
MIERLLRDTNIIIYSLDGNSKITKLIDGTEHLISEITEIELLGFHNLTRQDEKILTDYLSHTIIIGLNSGIKQTAITLKKRYKLKTFDAIIAASAVYHDVPLITADKQLKKVKELESIMVTVTP